MASMHLRLVLSGVVAAGLCHAGSAHAAPIAYSFSTGGVLSAFDSDPSGATPPGPNPALAAIFAGLAVTGSFVYDDERAPTSIANGPVGTEYIYDDALSSITGAVGGFTFADVGGRVQVSDDGLLLPSPFGLVTRDLLQISALPPDFEGFTLDGLGLRLENARLFWIEGNPAGTTGGVLPDVLTSYALPDALPSALGLFGFTFRSVDGGARISTVTFSSLAVAPASVPEPGTLSLLGVGGLIVAFYRRRRPHGAGRR